jgi:hypothetical protein
MILSSFRGALQSPGSGGQNCTPNNSKTVLRAYLLDPALYFTFGTPIDSIVDK